MAPKRTKRTDGGSPARRFDGLYNAFTAVGNADRDRTLSTTVLPGTSPVLVKSQLEDLYRNSRYIGRTIDLPAEEAIRAGWDVNLGDVDPAAVERAEKRERRLKLPQVLSQADKWAGLYGGGAVLLGIADGSLKPEEPVRLQKGTRLLWARPLTRHQLWPVVWQTDPAKERFGEPEVYELAVSASSLGSLSGRVHADRVLAFPGLPLPEDLAAETQYWGDSRVQRLWDAYRALTMVSSGIENVIHEWRIFVLKLKLLELLESRQGEADAEAAVVQRLEILNAGKSFLNAVVLDSEESAEVLSQDFAGVERAFRVFQEEYAAAAETPATLLFGQAPAGLSTDDKSGLAYWYARVGRRQRDVYEPAIRQYWRVLAAEQGILGAEAEVVFLPLKPQSAVEEADTLQKNAAAYDLLLGRRVVTENEVREELGFDPLPELDADEPGAPKEPAVPAE